MKYDITYACGHTGTVELFGKTADREYRLKYYEGCLCPECEAKERQKKNAESAAEAAEMDFPTLKGSEKQVAWAETIRLETYSRWMESFNDLAEEYPERAPKALDAINYAIQHATGASEWIDNRGDSLGKMLQKYRNMMEEEQRDAIPEDVVEVSAPTNQTHEGKVVITDKEGEIVARYPKDEDFRAIVKSLDYRWTDGAWRLRKNVYTGRSIDRVAELGSRLLNAGFAVQITDESARRAAIEGDYIPATKRWVAYNTVQKMLSISVPKEELYQAARKISGSKWYKPYVLVPVSMYKSVLDFISLYGYSVTPGAEKQIQAEIDALRVVEPGKNGIEVADANAADALQEILNSSRAVLDDLKDED